MEDLVPIAHIESDFDSKFGIPRQSGVCPSLRARVVFESAFSSPDAIRGIELWSHLWLIWQFSENVRSEWSPTVRPPRLGGNERLGVFATRSPYRPNALGLSCVKLEAVEANPPSLIVSGADLMNGTPIYDIKPYVPYSDCRPDAASAFAPEAWERSVEVDFPEELLALVPESKRRGLIEALSQDPRPAYQNDPERVYGLGFSGLDVRFRVSDGTLTVTEIIGGK